MGLEIIGAGFGRTGTLSLKFALEKLGFDLLPGEEQLEFSRDLNQRLQRGESRWYFQLGRWRRDDWPREREPSDAPRAPSAWTGVELDFRDDALRAVARKAMERKSGARGLRSILEAVLLDTMYEIPSLEGVSKVVIDGSVIAGESEPLLIYSQQEEARVDGTDG